VISHWDGDRWTAHFSPVDSELGGIWGLGKDDIWAGGQHIIHWDGRSWRRVPRPGLNFVHGFYGARPDKVWAAAGELLVWDGARWTQETNIPSGSLIATHICGLSESDVWLAGGSTAWHFNGQSWERFELGTQESLSGIHCIASDDVWLVGADDTVLHWDGAQWSSMMERGPLSNFYGVWGTSSRDVWIAGDTVQRWDGERWSDPLGGNFDGVWGSAPDDVWLITTFSHVPAQIAHYH
jgi:hypothetical protein